MDSEVMFLNLICVFVFYYSTDKMASIFRQVKAKEIADTKRKQRNAQEGIKTMASKLRTSDLIKGLTKYKETQNEEASKKRQAIMAEGQTDLAIRQPTPNSGIGKMADADSTVKPKGQASVQTLVEEFF